MKIAIIQTNPIIGDFKYNIDKIFHWIDKARNAGCDLAVFPELAVSGYPPQDLLERPAFLQDHDNAVNLLVKGSTDIAVLCGAITRHTADTGKLLHNSAILFENGRILASAHKRLLPTYDVFDESRYFEPARESKTFLYRGLRLGITICEDLWNDPAVFRRRLYDRDPVADLLADPAGPPEILINIAASPFRIGAGRIKREIFATHCIRNKLPLLYVNQVGGQDSLIFEGLSLCMNSNGEIIAAARQFEEDMLVIDTERLVSSSKEAIDDDHETPQVLEALVLGTRDYVTKSGFSKGVLGLSGGVDSALTASIAARALGPENILGVALPSPYTSQASIDDARLLAQNLGINFEIISINYVFDAFLETLDPFFPDQPPGVTEQNIQARIRGNLLMAFSNKFGSLLLTTGNKSEMAVGYCTLYGDMSGGLAVIADVPKLLVYKLSRLINREKEIIPWRTIERPPSAELAFNQKDQDDLPPYEILDPILAAYLEENKGMAEIIQMGFDREIVTDVVNRVNRNEYKRKQAPMGLKVTSKAFGYGRRYPTVENYSENF
ncbi:MAG: NAD+ synthase [Proteobacteria bacterium]|nr:NAD+ synthase [Pseudomonadota bacterium]